MESILGVNWFYILKSHTLSLPAIIVVSNESDKAVSDSSVHGYPVGYV
jgi:hypothetical protein